jgi:hypothetical protein
MLRFAPFLWRDLSLLGLCVALFSWDARLAAEPSLPASAVGVAAGLSAVLCAFLLHEWGHLCGALLAGGRVSRPTRLSSHFLFFFDLSHNGRREFLAMSFGGYIASVFGLAAFFTLLPLHTLSGHVALVGAALGVLATVLLEFPTTVRVLRGAPLPRAGSAYVSDPPPAEP